MKQLFQAPANQNCVHKFCTVFSEVSFFVATLYIIPCINKTKENLVSSYDWYQYIFIEKMGLTEKMSYSCMTTRLLDLNPSISKMAGKQLHGLVTGLERSLEVKG